MSHLALPARVRGELARQRLRGEELVDQAAPLRRFATPPPDAGGGKRVKGGPWVCPEGTERGRCRREKEG